MKKAGLFIILMTHSVWIFSQTPINDQAWNIFFADEFSGTTVDPAKWDHQPPWSSCHGQACLTTSTGNRNVSGGILNLIVKQENCNCTDWNATTHNKNYTSGAIFSRQPFKYGYFEIRCKIPELSGSAYTGKGFGPNFWLWPNHPDSYNNTPVDYSELDIFEFDAENNTHTCNIHYQEETSPKWTLRNANLSNVDPYDFQVNFSDFHKFGCEWTPGYINFYYDDKLIRSTSSQFADDLLPMNIWVDVNTPASNFGKDFVSNSLFPYKYEIDYVRVYNLKEDCATAIDQSNVNFTTFNYAVKKSITLSNSIIPFNTSVTLRANEYIQLKGEFVVPLGSELILAPTSCCN